MDKDRKFSPGPALQEERKKYKEKKVGGKDEREGETRGHDGQK